MTRLLLVAALLSIPTVAHAQSPGDCACAAPPVVVAHVEAPRKLGVSLRVGGLGIHPEAAPDDHTDYSGAGLAVSYRIWPRIGVELAADHFAAEDGRELQGMSLSATLHPWPRARWDVYGIAGLDALGAVSGDEQQLGGAHLGAGVERRFRRFGLSAEIRMLGLSEPQAEQVMKTTTMTTSTAPTYAGGEVTLAGTYYF